MIASEGAFVNQNSHEKIHFRPNDILLRQYINNHIYFCKICIVIEWAYSDETIDSTTCIDNGYTVFVEYNI